MHYNDKSSADIDKLFRDLSIQKTATEVKLKHLASGDFLECLNSSKLIFFLNWLYKSDLYLHYSSINNFYFSLVDIVDSCLGDIEKKAYGKHEMDMLKSELFRLASDNFEDFYNFLYSYDYPNIKPDKVSSFCDHIIGMIEMSEKTFWTECLMQLIKVGKKKEGLIFLENNKNLTTIDNYLHIYIRPIYTFINSYHILDNEDHIEKLLAEIELNYGHVKLNNYNFLDSKKSKMIWISDIIIGLVGKYFTYVNDIKIQDIDDSLNRLTKNQKKCLSLFNRIIIKSHNKNYMLIHSSISRYEHEKVGKILNWI